MKPPVSVDKGAAHRVLYVISCGSPAAQLVPQALLVTVLLLAAALAIRPLRAAFGALERLFYAAMIAWFPLLGVQLTGLR